MRNKEKTIESLRFIPRDIKILNKIYNKTLQHCKKLQFATDFIFYFLTTYISPTTILVMTHNSLQLLPYGAIFQEGYLLRACLQPILCYRRKMEI